MAETSLQMSMLRCAHATLRLALFATLTACATSGHGSMDEIDALMKRYEGNVPGASLLVVRDGSAVVRRSYGRSNLEDRIASTPETNYRLASVTKQFTAAAIVLLSQHYSPSHPYVRDYRL